MGFARYSQTPAEKEARQWQIKVDMANASLRQYAHLATQRELTPFEQRNVKRVELRLAKLMENNPNEPM